MKLAEALMERRALREHIEALKLRVYANARVQEGEVPAEQPAGLLRELEADVERFVGLITRINRTNAEARLPDGRTLAEAITRRDMLHLLQLVHENLASKATPAHERYSNREIRLLPTVDVVATRKQADALAREARLLDLALQQANWLIDIS
jgi:hypothetical protein